MTHYVVKIGYTTPCGSTPTFTQNVEATSPGRATAKAKKALLNNPRRKISRILDASAVAKGPFVTPKQPAEPKPLTYDPYFQVGQTVKAFGRQVQIRSKFYSRSGSTMFTVETIGGAPMFKTISERRLRVEVEPKITIEYVVLYPTGAVYSAHRAYENSTYGLDQLVQVKLTKENGKIIKKEIV